MVDGLREPKAILLRDCVWYSKDSWMTHIKTSQEKCQRVYGNTFEINLNLCFCCMKISCCSFFSKKNALIQVILNPQRFVEVKPRVCWNASTRRSSWWKDLVPGQSILSIRGCWKVPGPMFLGCKVGTIPAYKEKDVNGSEEDENK